MNVPLTYLDVIGEPALESRTQKFRVENYNAESIVARIDCPVVQCSD
jgi:hypothetical protein